MAILIRTIFRYSDRLALLWMLIIGYLSLIPMPELPEFSGSDKLHHFAAYALLTFLATLSRRSFGSLLLTLLLIIAYGGLIELLQPYVNRHGEVADLLANGGGAILGLAIVVALKLFRDSGLANNRSCG